MNEAGANRLRLFFALWPDDEVRRQIAAETDELITATGGNPVPAVNYHMTLAFLGSIRASSLDDILQIIRDVHFPAFKIRLDQTGYWPGSGTTWLGPSICPLELDALVDVLWNKLDDLGFVREDLQPYKPHVSLCRNVTGNYGVQLERPVEWPVTSFGLAKSSAAAGAPVYTILEQFPAGD